MTRKKAIDFTTNEKGCFICTSHVPSKRGYVYITRGNKQIQLHRFVYAEMFGAIPEGKIVRHKCDEPLCFNPEHLEIGTHLDNMRDARERGRTCCGEKNKFAVLTDEEVNAIRRLLSLGVKQKEIARTYGVTPKNISAINTGRTWKHLLRKEGADQS